MRDQRKPAENQLALQLRGESGRFLSIRGLSGPGSAGADRWAAECLTAKAETTDPAESESLSDAGAVNALMLGALAGLALAVGTTYVQHPRMVQVVVGLVVTVVTVALAYVVASVVRDNRAFRSTRTIRLPRRPVRVRVRPESHSPEWVGPPSRAQVEAVEWSSLPGKPPAAVVLWETFKGTGRRRKLRRATAGQVSAPMPRRSSRRTGGGRR